MWPDPRRAIGRAARTQRRRVERIDLGGGLGAQADMGAAFRSNLRHPCTKIDPDLRIALAEPDRRRPRHQAGEPSAASVSS